MRTLLFTLPIITLVSLSRPAGAQGLVNFSTFSGRVATNTFNGGPTTGLMSGPAGSYYFGLFVGPTTQTAAPNPVIDPSMAGWTFTGNYGTNIPTAAGRFSGNYTTDPAVIVPGWPVGSTANFVAIGWSANIGYDWSIVLAFLPYWLTDPGGYLNAWIGVSPVEANAVLGGGAYPVPTVPRQSFSLGYPVPEPGTLGLAGIALSPLLIRRSQKQNREQQ